MDRCVMRCTKKNRRPNAPTRSNGGITAKGREEVCVRSIYDGGQPSMGHEALISLIF